MKQRSAVIALAASTLLVLGACGNDSTGPAAGSTPGSTGKAQTSGEPILLGAVYPETGATNVVEFGKGLKAAEAYINNELGGIKGRPFKIQYCDDQSQDPSKNTACVRGFVTSKVTGILVYGSAFATGGLPIAEAAGIGAIGPGSGLNEQKSASTIILHGDQISGFSSLFAQAKKDGKSTVSALIIKIPVVIAGIEASLKTAASTAGVTFKQSVAADANAADYTPELLKAANGADIVTMSFGPAAMAQILKAGQASGLKVQFAASNTAINIPALVKPAGAAAEGLLAYSGTIGASAAHPQAEIFRQQMTKTGSEAQIGGVASIGFSYVMTAYEALKAMPDYKAATFLNYFKTTKIPVFLGQTYDPTKIPFPDRPAIHVTANRVLQVRNGAFVDVGGDWIDAFNK
jgi:ABC-type branched-subunit amino acid transport system substrate-binding protein